MPRRAVDSTAVTANFHYSSVFEAGTQFPAFFLVCHAVLTLKHQVPSPLRNVEFQKRRSC